MTDNAEHVRVLESIQTMCSGILSDEGRAALAAAIASLKATGWQPIESAPEYGWFLAFKPGVQVIVGTILGGDHPDCEFDGGVHEAWSHQYVDGITHWMPLPQPPKESE